MPALASTPLAALLCSCWCLPGARAMPMAARATHALDAHEGALDAPWWVNAMQPPEGYARVARGDSSLSASISEDPTVALDAPPMPIDDDAQDNHFQNVVAKVPDHSWVSVTRYATNPCAGRGCDERERQVYDNCVGVKKPYDEGRSKGYPPDCGAEYAAAGFAEHVPCGPTPAEFSKDAVNVSYGCWFQIQNNTGMKVNIGRALRVYDRGHAAQVLGLPCGSDDGRNEKWRWCDENSHPMDKLFCTRALERGYDSIMIVSGMSMASEMVICSGACAREAVHGSCVPVELRRNDANQTCACDDQYDYLNCGANVPIWPGGKTPWLARAPDPKWKGVFGGCSGQIAPLQPNEGEADKEYALRLQRYRFILQAREGPVPALSVESRNARAP